mgnify:CR=1 FL=1
MKEIALKLVERALRFILWFMPERCCNMIFMVSLIQYIRGEDALSKETLGNIVRVLNFGYSAEAALFPMMISSVIWRWADPQQVQQSEVLAVYRELDSQQIEALLNVAKQGNRNWQMYVNETKLREDVTAILSEHRPLVFA